MGKTEHVEEGAGTIAVPDFDSLSGERGGGGRGGDEPEELKENGFGEDPLCGKQWEDGGVGVVWRGWILFESVE